MPPSEDLLLEPLPLEAQLEKDLQTLRPDVGVDGPIPRMSKAELKDFVLGVLDGRYFTSDQIEKRVELVCPECKRSAPEDHADMLVDERGACRTCDVVPRPNVLWNVEPQLVFLPLAFMDEKLRQDLLEREKEIGIFWARLSASLPRGVNGYPMLTEMRIMHVEDWGRARKALIRESERRAELDLDDI